MERPRPVLKLTGPLDVRSTSLAALAILSFIYFLRTAQAVFIPVALAVVTACALTPLVSWLGHGAVDRISNASVLTVDDVPTLTSSGPLPILVAMTCTINRFELGDFEALGAALTRTPGAGAVAVWAASGLSMHAKATDLERTFIRLAAKTPNARVGDLIVQSLQANRAAIGETGGVYLLLGDPAIRLTLPAEVAPPAGPARRGE